MALRHVPDGLLPVGMLYLVDDDEIYQFITRKYLDSRQLSGEIHSFGHGGLALAQLQADLGAPDRLPDKILLDLSMPVMDGWAFLEAFSELAPRLGKPIEIYLVSSSINERDLERSRGFAAIRDYITKPLDDQKLAQIFATAGEAVR